MRTARECLDFLGTDTVVAFGNTIIAIPTKAGSQQETFFFGFPPGFNVKNHTKPPAQFYVPCVRE